MGTTDVDGNVYILVQFASLIKLQMLASANKGGDSAAGRYVEGLNYADLGEFRSGAQAGTTVELGKFEAPAVLAGTLVPPVSPS